jgi:hypothetical protein
MYNFSYCRLSNWHYFSCENQFIVWKKKHCCWFFFLCSWWTPQERTCFYKMIYLRYFITSWSFWMVWFISDMLTSCLTSESLSIDEIKIFVLLELIEWTQKCFSKSQIISSTCNEVFCWQTFFVTILIWGFKSVDSRAQSMKKKSVNYFNCFLLNPCLNLNQKKFIFL